MVYEVVSRHSFISSHGHNTTIQCTFYVSPGTLSTSFSYYWITIPDILFAVSMAVIYISAFEFLSAQVPSSTKGLMIGTAFIVYLLSNTIWFVVSLLFNSVSSFWGTGTISCGFWYTFTIATVQICICPFLIISQGGTRREEDKVCYQMNTSLLRDIMTKYNLHAYFNIQFSHHTVTKFSNAISYGW